MMMWRAAKRDRQDRSHWARFVLQSHRPTEELSLYLPYEARWIRSVRIGLSYPDLDDRPPKGEEPWMNSTAQATPESPVREERRIEKHKDGHGFTREWLCGCKEVLRGTHLRRELCDEHARMGEGEGEEPCPE